MNSKRRTIVIIICLAVAGVIGLAIASSYRSPAMNMPASSSAPTTAAVATNAVAVQGYAFSPAAITIKIGTTVTWTNQDSVQHTITGDIAGGPTSNLFGRGQTYSYTFNKAGTYTYHCQPHPYMKGSVVVTN